MRLNNGGAGSTSSKGAGGHSRNNTNQTQFEISEDFLNVSEDSVEEVHIGRGVNDLRNGRAVTPASSMQSARTRHTGFSADQPSRTSSALSKSSMRRRREIFASSDELHPYGLDTGAVMLKQSSRESPSPGRNVRVIDRVVVRRETTSSIVVDNGRQEQSSQPSHFASLDDRVHRSGHISTYLNNNKASSRVVTTNAAHDSLMSEESEMSRLTADVSTSSFTSAPVSHVFNSLWYYLTKLVTRVGNYIYLFIVGTFLFEKWCLYVKPRRAESTEEEHHGRYFLRRSKYRSGTVSDRSNGGLQDTSESELEQQNVSRLSFLHNTSFRDHFSSVRNRFNQYFTQGNTSNQPNAIGPIVEEDNVNYVSDDEDSVVVNSFKYRLSEDNANNAQTGRSSFLSASQLYGPPLMDTLFECLEFLGKLLKMLSRLSVVLLVIFLLWAYGKDMFSSMGTYWSSSRDAIWSAFMMLPNGILYVLHGLSAFTRSTELPSAQKISEPFTSSATTARVHVVSEDTVTANTNKESIVTIAALKSTKESLDALKLQIGLMEKIIQEHGQQLKTHDDAFANIRVEINKIYVAMEAASLKEKPLEQIVNEVFETAIGETAEGQQVSLKKLFAVLNEDRERLLDEVKNEQTKLWGSVEKLSKSHVTQTSQTDEIRASIEQMNLYINGLSGSLSEKQTGDVQKVEKEIVSLRAEMLEKLSNVEKQIKVDKVEVLEVVDNVKKEIHNQPIQNSPVVEPQMDAEKLKELLLPVLIPKIQMSQTAPCSEKLCSGKFSIEDIELLIKRAIAKYDADKTGLPDLALESAGGSILSTRCTKSSELRNSVISYWGFRLWSPPNTPRTIIQPGVVPGECWAFEGSVGDVVIKLAVPAIITAFTLEHIPKAVSRYMNIDSAPRHFQVLGLLSEHDTADVHDFGSFTYEDNDEPLQYFPVSNATTRYYPIVELKILSNHGNLRHTCIYRFRVHGAIDLTKISNGGGIAKSKQNSPVPPEASKASVSSNISN